MLTSIDIMMFESKVNTLVNEALSNKGDKTYLLDWFKGTLFVKGVNRDDMINIKNKVETFTDMMFSKVGDEYAIDFC